MTNFNTDSTYLFAVFSLDFVGWSEQQSDQRP